MYHDDFKLSLEEKGVKIGSNGGSFVDFKPFLKWETKIEFDDYTQFMSKEVREKKFKEAEDLIKFIKDLLDVYTRRA